MKVKVTGGARSPIDRQDNLIKLTSQIRQSFQQTFTSKNTVQSSQRRHATRYGKQQSIGPYLLSIQAMPTRDSHRLPMKHHWKMPATLV